MSRFLRDSLWVGAGSGVAMVANFLGQPVLNYSLGPGGRGVLVLIQTVISIVYECTRLGTNRASNYLAAKGQPIGVIVATDLLMAVAAILASAVALLVLVLRTPAEGESAVTWGMVAAALVGVVLRAVGAAYSSPLAGRQHFVQLSQYMVLGAAFLLVGRLTLVRWLGVSGALWAETMAVGAGAWAAWRFCTRTYGRLQRPQMAIARELFVFGLRSGVSVLAGLLTARASVMVLYAYVGPDGAGLYAAATAIGVPLATLPAILAGQLMPRSADMDDETAARQVGLVFRLSLVTTAVAAGLLVAVAPWLIELLGGPDFLPVVPAFQLLLIAIPIRGAGTILFGHLTGSGWPGRESVGTVLASVATILLSLLLVPRIGTRGAAVADVGGACVLLGAGAWYFSRLRRSPIADLVRVRRTDFIVLRQAFLNLRATRGSGPGADV